MGNVYANSFSYADDKTLLSPTIASLKKLIDICEEYSVEFEIFLKSFKCSQL